MMKARRKIMRLATMIVRKTGFSKPTEERGVAKVARVKFGSC